MLLNGRARTVFLSFSVQQVTCSSACMSSKTTVFNFFCHIYIYSDPFVLFCMKPKCKSPIVWGHCFYRVAHITWVVSWRTGSIPRIWKFILVTLRPLKGQTKRWETVLDKKNVLRSLILLYSLMHQRCGWKLQKTRVSGLLVTICFVKLLKIWLKHLNKKICQK